MSKHPTLYRFWLSCLLVITFMVSACAMPGGVQTYTLPDDNKDYTLGVGDKVHITVYDQEALTGDFKIEPSGKISFPLIKEVDAAGYTTEELVQNLNSKLSPGYLVNPKISVEVLTYRDVYILGEVQTPGKYEYVPNMTLLQAVAIAGGYTYRAQESGADVTRHVKGALKTFPVTNQMLLKPGDTVVVKRRWF